MMKRILSRLFAAAVLGFLFWIVYTAGHLDGHKHVEEAKLAAKAETPKSPPLTDWKKFYDLVKADKAGYMLIEVEASCADREQSDFTLFLVDGNRWYEMQVGGLWSCGGPHPDKPYRFFALPQPSFDSILKRVPSDDAKFVMVGPGQPKLTNVKISYHDKDRP
jgi:hypothetical protein